MRKMSKIHILLEWLMVICIISVGYSGWAISMPTDAEVSGEFQSYPIIKADDYVTIGSLDFDYSKSSQSDDNSIILNAARITIPVTMKKACFSSSLFNGEMGVAITVSIVDAQGKVNKDFFLSCNISENADMKQTGITDSGNTLSLNNSTGHVTLKQNLTWPDDTTVEDKVIYVYIDLTLKPSDKGDNIIVKSIYDQLAGTTLRVQAVVMDSIS